MTSEQTQVVNVGLSPSRFGLEAHGLRELRTAYWNLGTSQLVEHAIVRAEGLLSRDGSLVVRTGQFTGRSPEDKYIVRDETTETGVDWNSVNQPMSEPHFERLYQ